jgi:hypothetical protein
VEKWTASPELGLDVRPLGHTQDAWAGWLNVPATLTVPSTGARAGSAGAAAEPDVSDEAIAIAEAQRR